MADIKYVCILRHPKEMMHQASGGGNNKYACIVDNVVGVRNACLGTHSKEQ
jgi:hypothetical protein